MDRQGLFIRSARDLSLGRFFQIFIKKNAKIRLISGLGIPA